MAFAGNDAKRVGQSRYWALFGANIVVMALLLLGAGFAMISGSWGLGLLMIAAIAPLGIYWRIIMMRRCRDIGWPPSAPWFVYGAQAAMSLGFGLNHSPVVADSAVGSAFLLASFVALADLVLMIVIGCIATKQPVDYRAIFGDGSGTFQRTHPREGEPLQGVPERFDDAIARALEVHRRREALRGGTQPSHPAPAHFGRRSAGFGRRPCDSR